MAYARMNGQDGAFGWYQDRSLLLGGLLECGEYLLLCETGEEVFTTDAHGAARVPLAYGAPLCVTQGDRVLLYNAERLDGEAAYALAAARREALKKDGERAEETRGDAQMPETAAPSTAETVNEEAAAGTVKTEDSAQETAYRAPSRGLPVDALPALAWPEAAAQLRPYFEKNRPLRLLEEPGWRCVRAREAGMDCCFGYRAEGDRVAEVLYAVRARGGLIPPRGLQGYRCLRLSDGVYWALRQPV